MLARRLLTSGTGRDTFEKEITRVFGGEGGEGGGKCNVKLFLASSEDDNQYNHTLLKNNFGPNSQRTSPGG